MEDDRRRPKEFYQVTLDTGRIFWISFFIGIAVIGIFVFGFFAGGGKVLRDIFDIDKSEVIKTEEITEEEKETGEELALLDLLEENLRAETRYIDINSIESAAEELQKKPRPDVYFEEQQTVKDTFEEPEQVKALVPDEPYHEKTIPYVERGDYYIQVASFNEKANAESFAKSLRKKMYKVIIEEALVEEKTFFRVRVGPFETKGIAKNTMAAMKNRYSIKDPFVLKKNS